MNFHQVETVLYFDGILSDFVKFINSTVLYISIPVDVPELCILCILFYLYWFIIPYHFHFNFPMNKKLNGFMAVTAHWSAQDSNGKSFIQQSQLVAFRHVTGPHDGTNLGSIFVDILKELGILNNVSLLFSYLSLLSLKTTSRLAW